MLLVTTQGRTPHGADGTEAFDSEGLSYIRLYILGTPGDMQGAPPGVDTVSVGGMTLSHLIFPTVGTSLSAALGL